ncbi:hypothetical protein VOLCADRAFT_93201 [Volvox carteri f. nagariensis]|uniref:DUF948 domain-containing protein n=1 Tax=Volvox carteri f. nagariensis TaxID=3068 RepID=D8U1J9_VOLCA|nr:uncharacterized protein VOLCADRAFT_93201 [Volvox carteri f. nagariensis]EFJ46353.1 hypothetical protein VOLCADRAFT_93201 [Volvox carteri f. nagariensis]|eukprot:XP_002952506.1 hypothetical protein VOLCADRAFT_93201 [Volvox carteri f. nagariensis]
MLPSIGTFLLCVAAAALLLVSVPAVWALTRAAHRAERLMAAVEAEIPDTTASMRLAGLELTDCVQELAAEAGVRGSVAAADSALRNHVVPALAKAERDTRGAVEEHLTATAKLSYTRPLVVQAAASAAAAARRLRGGLGIVRLAGVAVQPYGHHG